jgi:hypothetical protein
VRNDLSGGVDELDGDVLCGVLASVCTVTLYSIARSEPGLSP